MKTRMLLVILFISLLFVVPSLLHSQQMPTRAQYIQNIVQLLGWEYKLPENPVINDYVSVLNKEGFDVDPSLNMQQPITTEEKSFLINRVCSCKMDLKQGQRRANINKAVIDSVRGKVSVLCQGNNEWVEAKAGMQLTQADTIKTSSGSEAKLSIGMYGKVIIGESSEVNLGKLSYQAQNNAESIILNLAMGSTIADVRNITPTSNFEIHTPTTIAAVRGTIYKVEVTLEKDHTVSTKVK